MKRLVSLSIAAVIIIASALLLVGGVHTLINLHGSPCIALATSFSLQMKATLADPHIYMEYESIAARLRIFAVARTVIGPIGIILSGIGLYVNAREYIAYEKRNWLRLISSD